MIEAINVLIIDDDPAARYLTKRSLISYDSPLTFVIQEVVNGAEGIQTISTTASIPHIVLLDIHMPVMDGYDFLDAFYRLPLPTRNQSNIYIVSTIANELPGKVRKLVKGFFEKPITKDHVKTMITSMSLNNA